jgi:hypothetical protein
MKGEPMRLREFITLLGSAVAIPSILGRIGARAGEIVTMGSTGVGGHHTLSVGKVRVHARLSGDERGMS